MAITITKATVGGDENTWGTKTNLALDTILNAINGTSGTVAPNLSTLTINSVNVTATAAELNKLSGTPAGLTSTELGYVDGVTSAIQTQLNSKQATITGGASSIASSNLTASRALVSDGSGKVAVASNISTTELDYLNGVSSNIQTQLDAKQATISGGATTIDTENLTTNRALISNGSGKVAVANVTSTELGVLDGGTAATSTTVAGADRVVFNDNGTMKQVSMSDIATYTSAQVSSPTVNNATITLQAGNDLSGGGTITLNQSSNETVTFSHGNTSNLDGATSNSGSTYIQNITVDDNGHIQSISATDVSSNISSSGLHSMGYATGGASSGSTTYRFSGAISVPNNHTITGWSSDEHNMSVTWRSNYQGALNSMTQYGTGSYTNTSGSAVTVYAWANTINSESRSVTYMIFG